MKTKCCILSNPLIAGEAGGKDEGGEDGLAEPVGLASESAGLLEKDTSGVEATGEDGMGVLIEVQAMRAKPAKRTVTAATAALISTLIFNALLLLKSDCLMKAFDAV